MKVTKFRIKNFKSIVDSGDCYLADGVTILAGKNESGKSSILEALEDFNTSRTIREKAIPITRVDAKPSISVWFDIDHEELERAISIAGVEVAAVPTNTSICVTKSIPNNYSFSGDFIQSVESSHKKIDYLQPIKDAYATIDSASIKSIANTVVALPPLNLSDLATSITTFTNYQAQIAPHLTRWPQPDQTILTNGLITLLEKLNDAKSNAITPPAKFRNTLLKWLPNFILFSSFDDVFPNTILLTELKDNKWIKDLQAMTDIDVGVITGNNDRAKVTHKKHLNTRLNEDFKQFWSQDLSQLVVEWDNAKLNFWVEEDGHYYEPEIRSQGRRWHLAFYIRVSARAREDVNNVILIDEPGLYLHANAQRDVLKNLESAAKKTPVIFSTHSPYLIEPDKLERIRLVQKFEKLGTVIENKIHKVADKETLTPILTAIGLELTNGIVNIKHQNNIIVEGPSDYYYLNAFARLFDWNDLSFVSGGSSGNMPKIGTILQGWGCNVVYLYDNDQAYQDALKSIKRDWLNITSEILGKLPIDGAIEDIFSKDDFAKHVLDISPSKITERNSDYMRDKDKVLVAKLFLEKISSNKESFKLSQETIKNAKKLHELFIKLFKSEQGA